MVSDEIAAFIFASATPLDRAAAMMDALGNARAIAHGIEIQEEQLAKIKAALPDLDVPLTWPELLSALRTLPASAATCCRPA